MHIYISNRSTVLPDTAVQAALPAFTHFARVVADAWQLRTPILSFTDTPPADSWQLVILDNSDQAGALGYHDFAVGGRPIAKVFAKTDQTYKESWTVTLTHELAEMQADPWINTCVQTSDTRLYALEVGDPVEDDTLAFTYTTTAGVTVLLSDFVLPSWFQPGATAPYDYKHRCARPLQVLAGGYAQYLEDGQWNQVGPNGRHMAMDPDDLRLRTRFS